MPSVGFEPKISEGERPKTYALDRAATGTGSPFGLCCNFRVEYPEEMIPKAHYFASP